MLELTFLRNHREEAIARLGKRNIEVEVLLARFDLADAEAKSAEKALQEAEQQRNNTQAQVDQLFRKGDKEAAMELRMVNNPLYEAVAQLSAQAELRRKEREEVLLTLPNAPADRVPAGRTPEDNVVVVQEGAIPELGPGAKPHWELGEEYGILHMDLGVKLTGAGFPVYSGQGARLQRALIAFFLDRATAAGYREIIPPHLVNGASAYATGQLPDKEGQMYHATVDDLYLIPTAEVPITNLYRDEIIDAARLPIRNVGYTPCFRREAGSYGAHVRGLNRVHQFDKVEIVRVEKPENSYAALEEMVEHVKGLLRDLELPFRQLLLCGGDMGFASALTYDMEVFSAAQQRWLEVSSISNFETFQSNRLKLRYRGEDKKPRLAHTLNGSALALARIVAALLENNQTPDGIRIPKALQPYTGFDRITR